MSLILHEWPWFRFINIFLSTFDRLASMPAAKSRRVLLYDITYLKLVRLCANEGFFFVKSADDQGKLRLVCSDCAAWGHAINEWLTILACLLANSTFVYASTARFSRHIRQWLRLFHADHCLYFSDQKKKPHLIGVDNLSLLDAFELVRQLDRCGLLLNRHELPNEKPLVLSHHDAFHVVDITCRVCFAGRAVIATPCGHVFQCLSCWCALIYAHRGDKHPSVMIFDDIDIRTLRHAMSEQSALTNLRFLGRRRCPVCRGYVVAVQQLFI